MEIETMLEVLRLIRYGRATEQSYQRGESYYKNGAVIDTSGGE